MSEPITGQGWNVHVTYGELGPGVGGGVQNPGDPDLKDIHEALLEPQETRKCQRQTVVRKKHRSLG